MVLFYPDLGAKTEWSEVEIFKFHIFLERFENLQKISKPWDQKQTENGNGVYPNDHFRKYRTSRVHDCKNTKSLENTKNVDKLKFELTQYHLFFRIDL